MRLWVADPKLYGTSTTFDFSEPKHYCDIVKVMGLLRQQHVRMDHAWQPAVGMTLSIVDGNRRKQLRIVSEPTYIGLRCDLFGRRTCVWSVWGIIDGAANSANFVVKTGWLLPRLQEHELDVIRCLYRSTVIQDFTLLLPQVVGQVLSSTGDLYDESNHEPKTNISKWQTRSLPPVSDATANTTADEDRFLKLSVLVVQYPRVGQILSTSTTVADLIRIYRNILKTLKHCALEGIHYRDLNLGNILQDVNDPGSGFLIDYGGARVLNHRRGQVQREMNPTESSLDDFRSANSYFVSSRVQAIEAAKAERERIVGELEEHRQNFQRLSHLNLNQATYPKEQMAIEKQLRDTTAALDSMSHRYIDDFESAMYTFLFHVRNLFY